MAGAKLIDWPHVENEYFLLSYPPEQFLAGYPLQGSARLQVGMRNRADLGEPRVGNFVQRIDESKHAFVGHSILDEESALRWLYEASLAQDLKMLRGVGNA